MGIKRRYVLLDRDGTLIEDRHYLAEPEGVELVAGVASGLRQLQDCGLGLAVVTNQSGVGRGYFCVADVDRLHRRLCDLLAEAGVHIDGFYYCPHTPHDGCECRKPAPGLAWQAANGLGFNLRDCFMIGDRASDIEFGRNVGATTFMVRTGYGKKESAEVQPDYMVDDLGAAVPIINCLCETGYNNKKVRI